MLNMHNRFMRGTRLDIIIGLAGFLLVLSLLALILGPARALARERDKIRTSHVRDLMTKVLQLELIEPDAYARLVSEVTARGDMRSVIGFGDCSGSRGLLCANAITADECLSLGKYFPQLLLSEVPIDPIGEPYGVEATGYYLSIRAGELEVGACATSQGEVYLRTRL